jgi:membrane-bound metal-dependent hydrolase YbcI (DUF457 family)
MELFGHAFSGLCLAQALRPDDRAPRFWLAAGAVGALAPDIDAITYLAGPDAFYRFHQIYTHNLIAFAVAPPLLALLLQRTLAPPGASRGRILALVWGAWGLHLLGDTIAHWPLRLLYPFSREGLALRLIPGDFSIGLALLLLGGVGLSFVDVVKPHRRAVAWATLASAAFYVVLGPGW